MLYIYVCERVFFLVCKPIDLECDILIRGNITSKNLKTDYFGHDRCKITEIRDI